MWQTISKWFGSSPAVRQARPAASSRPTLEGLEDRMVLSTYSNLANHAYNDLRIGYAMAGYNYTNHPNNGYARQGYLDSRAAFQYAIAAVRTGSATYWNMAHRYADAAQLDEMRYNNNAPFSAYAKAAINYEYAGSVNAFNTSLYAPRK